MLWQPSDARKARSSMQQFIEYIDHHYGLAHSDYHNLYQFSINNSEAFWKELVLYFDIRYDGELTPVNNDASFNSYAWFLNVSLNFAENLLAKGREGDIALVSLRESGARVSLSYGKLKSQVAKLQDFIKADIGSDDVLACYMPNIPETVVAMLATAGLGGIFTSTSCDFGVEGVVDRFSQSKPKILVASAAYCYNGKIIDCLEKIARIAEQLPSVSKVIVVDFLGEGVNLSHIPNALSWNKVYEGSESDEKSPQYVKRAFSDPLYIMYSSGTTGKPKCIVHCVGGVLLQHVKELGLHTDVNRNKNIMFFTTCGWMMWNWLVSALYFGATVTLYEGSPAYPSLSDFLKLIKKENIHIFGTSPKFLRAVENSDTDLSALDFASLETILSTGAPLLPEQYDFVYKSIKPDLLLASISGGTDIVGCFFLGNPTGAVYRGELQCRGLGMDVVSFDEHGNEVVAKEGELVCRKSFPSRPIYFLNDSRGKRLREAYFSHFANVWYHGDYILITEQGGAIFYGRSDATLNPGGVRIGTSEIYRQTETLDYVDDSVCIGREQDGDVELILFVKLHRGEQLTEERITEIKTHIRRNTTPRHVPEQILAVKAIPYTRSGKKIELAVSKVVNGKSLTNLDAIANPDSLEEYKNRL